MPKYTTEEYTEVLPSYASLPDLLPKKQLAELLNIKECTLDRDRATKRRWPFTKFGREVLYPKARIADLLIENMRGG